MTIKITQEEYEDADESGMGYCLACGESQFECEPDAREYVCESCGEAKVYGAAELLIMGEIEFIGDDE